MTRKFTLPLGMFQIQMPATVIEALGPLGKALEDLVRVMGVSPSADFSEFTDVIETVKAPSDQFQSRLKSTEFPCVLPPMTYELIYASLVAEAFQLRFEITDYSLERTDANWAYWWVEGEGTDLNGQRLMRPGTSFTFNPDDEKQSEGALLSACADAFIHCVFAAVPHVPWTRWKNRKFNGVCRFSQKICRERVRKSSTSWCENTSRR